MNDFPQDQEQNKNAHPLHFYNTILQVLAIENKENTSI